MPINYTNKITGCLHPGRGHLNPYAHSVNKHGRGPLADATYQEGMTQDGHPMTTIWAKTKKGPTIQRYMESRISLSLAKYKAHHEEILFLHIYQKAQIRFVTIQVDQSICFFATLIENRPTLIE